MSLIKKSNGGFFPQRTLLNDFFGAEGLTFDRLFTGETLPAVNITETDKNFEIELAAPGMQRSDFEEKSKTECLPSLPKQGREGRKEKELYPPGV